MEHTNIPTIQLPNLIAKLENLSKQPNIKILSANFDTEEIVITLVDSDEVSFNSVMEKIKFVELSPRLKIKTVDFTTGHISINLLSADKFYGLTNLEIEYIKSGRMIEAIKAVRVRTNFGLKEAKDLCEKVRDDSRRGL